MVRLRVFLAMVTVPLGKPSPSGSVVLVTSKSSASTGLAAPSGARASQSNARSSAASTCDASCHRTSNRYAKERTLVVGSLTVAAFNGLLNWSSPGGLNSTVRSVPPARVTLRSAVMAREVEELGGNGIENV